VFETGVYEAKFEECIWDASVLSKKRTMVRTRHESAMMVWCFGLAVAIVGFLGRVFSGVQTSECLRYSDCKDLCYMAFSFWQTLYVKP
jgi:hypothetical protein